MGFFDMFKKKETAPVFPAMLAADAAGTVVKMEEIPDEVFAQGILGQCCGIDPSVGEVYAPCDGEITQAPDTLHALGIMGSNGIEVLIHVGVDTVEMKGDGFAANVKLGDKVTKGQLLLTMDLDKIKAAGHPAVVITVVTNTDDFAEVTTVAQGTVKPGDDLMKVSK
ncbi:MAG: PTS glucose transporter subunit IIA [Gemmiger sp.]|uniref:PTS sugar transporter subunit IIA n=1 Tax=Gemmiger sp. TaxID=2049027 RepID=UPI002E7A9F0E|nr:PTS glucose transporter subunit IIA [Gemmiger sp.]MEE0801193.1 PTS glucose transporter subunit IIA [Gemmiger sp.]